VTIRHLLLPILLLAAVTLTLALANRHATEWDFTAQRSHSLSQAAASALDAMQAGTGLQITVFVGDLPVIQAEIDSLLQPYRAHPALVSYRAIDPVADPDLARAAGVSRHAELHLRSGRRLEVVREFQRDAIDAALARLALRGERWIIVLRGHGEAAVDDGPGGIGRFVQHVEHIGYRALALDPREIGDLPDNTALVIAAGPTADYPAVTERLLRDYRQRGGALLWLFDTAFPAWAVSELGLSPLPGIVVDAAAVDYALDRPENAVVGQLPPAIRLADPAAHAVLHRARGLDVQDATGWSVIDRLRSSPRSWNETGELRGGISRDPARGEHPGPITVGVLLQRSDDTDTGRIALIGGHDWLSNAQLGLAGNLALATGLVRWLTDNRELVTATVNERLDITWSAATAGILAALSMYLLPVAFVASGIWLRHHRRKA
jgi:hypothetical protein